MIVSVFLAINLMGVNLGYNDEALEGSPPVVLGFISLGLTLVIFALLGRALFGDGLRSLMARRSSVELPFLLGITATLVFSCMNLFNGSGPIYFETAGILLVVYSLGKWVGAKTRFAALSESRAMLSRFLPEYQRIARDGSRESVPVEALKKGDRIIVPVGSIIPADGLILDGASHVGEMMFTGEPLPSPLKKGDPVFAGTKSHDGELVVGVEQVGAETRLGTIFGRIEDAIDRPNRWTNDADLLLRWFVPVLLAIVTATFIFWTVRVGFDRGLMNALSVLVVACPCALGIATPVVLWAGVGAFARAGIEVRDPEAIERLSRVDFAALDKTGTLTRAKLDREDIVFCAGQDSTEILARLSHLQTFTDHPYAALFSQMNLTGRADEIVHVEPLAGVGIAGLFREGREEIRVAIGNDGLLASEDDFDQAARLSCALKTLRRNSEGTGIRCLFFKVNERLSGAAFVREEPVQDFEKVFRNLEMPVEILTGDPMVKGRDLFITFPSIAVSSGLSPAQKAERIFALQSQGWQVLFVGDGVNDAEAIAAADVAFAIAKAGSVPAEAAHFVMSGKDLDTIIWAKAAATKISNVLRTNLYWAAGYNLFGTVVAAAGLLEPVFAAILMTSSSLLVSWRAHRLREALLQDPTRFTREPHVRGPKSRTSG